MNEEDLAVLGQAAAAFEAEGWAGAVPFLHEDFEFHEPPEQPGATVFRGPEAAQAGWARWAESWTEQRIEIREFQELPDGRVFVTARARMRGRDGIEFTQDSWNVLTVRDAKVLRWESYWDRSNALAAAGLPDED